MSRTAFRPRSLALLILVSGAPLACATQPVERPSAEMAAVAPMLSVERFLQAANGRDFDAMASLFGTYRGPIEGDRREIELHMSTLAEILNHQDYQITGEERAPGREYPTNRIAVNITQGSRVVRDVPFFVVRSRDGSWLVEEIGLLKITGG